MGAKDWMLLYADRQVQPILAAAPVLDRDATRALVRRLYPAYQAEIADGTLLEQASPGEDRIYAGCFPGLSVVCASEVAVTQPSRLDQRFLAEGRGRTVYLHAMHSGVDWFAYAIWSSDRTLRRALSLSPDDGIIEDIGPPLEFEEPYWSGERPMVATGGRPYPLPFHPLELAEAALRALFGFNYEGLWRDDDFDLERIVLAGFALQPIVGGL